MPFESLFDVAEWAAEYKSRNDEYWEQQKRLNVDMLNRIKSTETTQASMKLHLGILIGICSVLGPVLGNFLLKVLL